MKRLYIHLLFSIFCLQSWAGPNFPGTTTVNKIVGDGSGLTALHGTNIQANTISTNAADATFHAWVLAQSSEGISAATATNIAAHQAELATNAASILAIVSPLTNAAAVLAITAQQTNGAYAWPTTTASQNATNATGIRAITLVQTNATGILAITAQQTNGAYAWPTTTASQNATNATGIRAITSVQTNAASILAITAQQTNAATLATMLELTARTNAASIMAITAPQTNAASIMAIASPLTNAESLTFTRRPSVCIVAEMRTNALATGTNADWIVPSSLNGFRLSRVSGYVNTAGTTMTNSIALINVTSNKLMTVTNMIISSTSNYNNPAVTISNTATVGTDNLVIVRTDGVCTTAPKGLIVSLEFIAP